MKCILCKSLTENNKRFCTSCEERIKDAKNTSGILPETFIIDGKVINANDKVLVRMNDGEQQVGYVVAYEEIVYVKIKSEIVQVSKNRVRKAGA